MKYAFRKMAVVAVVCWAGIGWANDVEVTKPTFIFEDFNANYPVGWTYNGFSWGSGRLSADLGGSITIPNIALGENALMTFYFTAVGGNFYYPTVSVYNGSTWNSVVVNNDGNTHTGTRIVNLSYYANQMVSIRIQFQNGDNTTIRVDDVIIVGARYTVTFDANGGTIDTATAMTGTLRTSVESLQRLASLSTPTWEEGYAFAGWFTSATGGEEVTTSTIFTEAITVYAQWVPIYTINFDADDGEVTPKSGTTGGKGTLATLPTPTKTGYDFVGWFTAKIGGEPVTTNTLFEEETTIYAQWTVSKYTVRFDLSGGSGTNPTDISDVSHGSTLTDIQRPSTESFIRAGYVNDGKWYTRTGTSPNFTFTEFMFGDDGIAIMNNTILYLQWTRIYTVNFNLNNGSGTTPASIIGAIEGSTLSDEQKPTTSEFTRSGYVVDTDKWYVRTGTGTTYNYINVVARDRIGNGWGNGALRIVVNGTNRDIRLNSGSSDTYMYSVNPGDFIQVYWLYDGGWDDNDNECAFAIYYTNNPPSPAFNPAENASNDTSRILFSRQYNSLGSVRAGTLLGSFYIADDYTYTEFVSGDGGTEIMANTTLYLRWLPSYIVTFNNNGEIGTAPASIAVERGKTVNTEQMPSASEFTKRGYVCDGKWYIRKNNTRFIEDFQSYTNWPSVWKIGDVPDTWGIVGGALRNVWKMFTNTTGGNKYMAIQAAIALMEGPRYNNNFSISHLYRDITFPESEDDFTMSFDFWGKGSNLDNMAVSYSTTSFTPIEDHAFTFGTQIGYYYNVSKRTRMSVILPASVFSGKTMRIVFTWKNTASTVDNPPAAIDDIVITTPIYTEFIPESTIVSDNTTLYLQWKPVTYAIIYNLNGGDNHEFNSVSYTIESEVIMLNAPTKNGYSFGGWYDNPDLTGTAVTSIPANSTEDREYWAKWTPITYTITYNSGNHPDNPTSYTIESPDITLNAPLSLGFTFDGWYASANTWGEPIVSEGAVTSIPTGSTGDKRFWAKWTQNVYTITFDANDGTVSQESAKTLTNSFEATHTLSSLPTPTRTGYTFIGWFTEKTDGAKVAAYTTKFYADTTIYAQWTHSRYRITFDANGGIAPTPTFDSTGVTWTLASLPTPIRTGYIFDGWFTASGDTAVTTATVFSANATVYARWTAVVSIATPDRIIPPTANGEEAAVVTPIKHLSSDFTAGPNVIDKNSGGIVKIYRQGGRIDNAVLTVYNSYGDVVNKVSLSDNFDNSATNSVRRVVGSWDLRDSKKRLVVDGTYLIGGVVTVDGKKEKVSLLVNVR